MRRQRLLFAVVLALSVTLAGCSALDTGGDQTDAGPGETNGTIPDDISEQVIESIASVEKYRVEATQTQTIIGPQRQSVETEQRVDVNRADQRLHRTTNQTVLGRTIRTDTYLANETVYQRSPVYVQQFSTEWIEVDTEGNVTRAFRAADPLARQSRVLETASFEANGTETIDGRDVYRIEADADPEQLEDLFAELVGGPGTQFNESTYSLTDATYTFRVAADTNRPLRVTGELESQVVAQGQEVTLRQSFDFEYNYTSSVSIDLPEAASSAVPLSEILNGTDPGT
ncbi:MAG: DUF6612 family protein [Halobacteriales archaeon]